MSNVCWCHLAIKNFQRAAKALRDKAKEVTDEQRQLDLANQTIAASQVQLASTADNRKQACKPGL